MKEFEALRVVGLLERIETAFDQIMPRREEKPLWKIAAHLLSAEYSGRLVTITSLGSVTGLSYATSRRYIKSLIDEGLIKQAARGPTGKSHSLHPSEQFKTSFESYLQEIKSILAETVGTRDRVLDGNEYYFGAPASARYEPPNALRGRATKGEELKFLVNNDNYFAALRNVWADFRNDLGSSSSFVMLDCAKAREELIANSRRAISSYDIVSVNVAWLSEVVESGIIQPISGLLDDTHYAAPVADADLKSLGMWREQTFGVPIYCHVNLFAARQDIFERYRLKMPSTFDEVIDAGRRLAAEGETGIIWDAGAGIPVAQTFLSLLPAAGNTALSPRGLRDGLVPVDPGEDQLAGILSSPTARQTLNYMHRLVDISPPDILDMAWEQSADRFLAGGAAMFYGWSTRATRFEYDIRSVMKRRVKYLPQPAEPGGTRATPLSGFLLAVPANVPRERARLAAEAIGWLISTESGQQSGHGLPLAPRFATAADPEMKASYPVISFMGDLARKRLVHTRHRPATPYYGSIEEIVGEEIHAALRGAQSDDAAIANIGHRVADLARVPRRLLNIPVAA
ncbi:MAG: extracellular solute-binding protein [Mesorhizobium sp.]